MSVFDICLNIHYVYLQKVSNIRTMTLSMYIEVPVASQERERPCFGMLGESMLPLLMQFFD